MPSRPVLEKDCIHRDMIEASLLTEEDDDHDDDDDDGDGGMRDSYVTNERQSPVTYYFEVSLMVMMERGCGQKLKPIEYCRCTTV
jgi:hypothetical protein